MNTYTSPIRAIRQRLQMNQAQLAEALGLHPQSIVNYEARPGVSTRMIPSPKVAMRLADYCAAKGIAVTLEQIYGRQPIAAEGDAA